MSLKYYEDYKVGDAFTTTGRTISESDILQFAALTGDWNRVHTDAEYCRETPYGERIAHGLFGLALMEGLKFRLGHHDGTAIASLGWNVTFAKPIFVGDTLHCQVEITKVRETKKPDRGIIWEQVLLVNQRGETVTEAEHSLLLYTRAGAPA